MKTYTCRVDVILDDGRLLEDSVFNRPFSVVIQAMEDEFRERDAAREAAAVDALDCFAQKFGKPLPRRIVPHLLFVTDLNGRVKEIQGEIRF